MSGLRKLERLARGERQPARQPGAACELCAAPIGEPHPHVVDLQRRSLCCSCPTCAVLFRSPAAGSHFRTVPDRVVSDSAFALTEAQWADLQIPVGLAFVFYSSAVKRWVAVYPSPAGATESELSMEKWSEMAAANPLMAAVQPDVEALLVDRRPGHGECLLVPIDACYELVGIIRQKWKGFDGGDEVRRDIAAFFEKLRRRARPLPAGGRR